MSLELETSPITRGLRPEVPSLAVKCLTTGSLLSTSIMSALVRFTVGGIVSSSITSSIGRIANLLTPSSGANGETLAVAAAAAAAKKLKKFRFCILLGKFLTQI